MICNLAIQNGSKVCYPTVADAVTWELERKGVPGRLDFSLIKDDNLDFQEGNTVRFAVDGTEVFYGYVFTKKRGKDNVISVTAYDQLRYLKNKDTYNYKNLTAAELILKIAGDFNLRTGVVCDTAFKIEKRTEDNQTLFDIINTALSITTQNTGKLYVLYDDYGRLCLKSVENMKTDIVIDEDTAEDFDYSSSIDGETYNKIKLIYDNSEDKKREVYITYDSGSIAQWGVLQLYDTLQAGENGKAKADTLLSNYNKKTRSLQVSGALGNLEVRAGTLIPVRLSLGDIEVFKYMLTDKVKHKFENNAHTMDLTLIGGDFVA